MEAVFDTAINVSDFRRRASGDSDQWVLTTAPLKRYLHHLTRPENIKFSSYASIRTLIPAFSITASLDTYHGQMITDGSRAMDLVHFLRTAHYAQPIDSRIVMSIRILLSFLCDVQIRSYSWGNDESITKDDATVVDLSFSNEQGFIYHRMRCDGWCPFQLSRMFTMLNSCALYFMSHVEPPDPFTKHHTIRIWPQSDLPSSNSTGQTDRENIYWTGDICTRTKCVAYSFDDSTYQTKHVQGCEGCYDVIADYDEVFEILKKGYIPLILSVDSTDESRKVTLVESGSDVEYIAISHVWSDGLGNIQRSALPRCQMLRLSNLIRNLPGKAANILLFWIDTIGCPPDRANQSAAQDLAIRMMRQTYENARAVLVLESSLQKLSVKKLSDEEALLRIVCSKWNSRLWTLQEGALARNLFFQFADAAYDHEEGFKRLTQIDNPILVCSLRGVIFKRLLDFRAFKDKATNQLDRISAIRNALTFRSTSVATDEALCLAALFNLDVLPIIETIPENRMIQFWRSFKTVPANILWSHYSRLEAKGFRWAPRSLHQVPDEVYFTPGYGVSTLVPALRTDDGLLFQEEGWMFCIQDTLLPSRFYVRYQGRQWNRYDTDYSSKEDCYPTIGGDGTTGGVKVNVLKNYNSKEVAFVQKPDNGSGSSIWIESEVDISGILIAVL